MKVEIPAKDAALLQSLSRLAFFNFLKNKSWLNKMKNRLRAQLSCEFSREVCDVLFGKKSDNINVLDTVNFLRITK